MHVLLLALALQLRAPALNQGVQRASDHAAADSARDLGRAHGAQASFERSRRALLPRSSGGGGRCDVRLGRFCWWYDENPPTFPAESQVLRSRRAELLAELDAIAARYPGDDWLAATRVHYHIDAKEFAQADSVAAACRATGWWCSALAGYAANAGGNAARSDSAFAAAMAGMPEETACAWRDITALLGPDDHDLYEHRSCAERRALEEKYWLLSRPQLSSGA